MRLWVERHRSRAALGLQSLKDSQFIWRFFSRDCRRAITAGCKRELRGEPAKPEEPSYVPEFLAQQPSRTVPVMGDVILANLPIQKML